MLKPAFFGSICLLLLGSCQPSRDSHQSAITAFNGETGKYEGPEQEVRLLSAFPAHLYETHYVKDLGYFHVERDLHYDYIKHFIRLGVRYEAHLSEIMAKYIPPGSTVLDIGAHIGTHAVNFSKLVGLSGSVLAFEPQVKIFAELTNNLQINGCRNVKAMRCALGNRKGMIEMYPATTGNEGGTPIGSGGDSAQMLCLDDLNLTGISFIKIDVENSEYEVLLGARETLKRNRPVIMIEIMGNHVYTFENRQERVDQILDLLRDYDYEVTNIQENDWLATPLSD